MLLTKAQDQRGGLCWCGCAAGRYAVYEKQADCPWCGCGWLWFCSNCQKGLTVAVDAEGNEFVLLARVPRRVGWDEARHHFTLEGRTLLSDPSWWDDRGRQEVVH